MAAARLGTGRCRKPDYDFGWCYVESGPVNGRLGIFDYVKDTQSQRGGRTHTHAVGNLPIVELSLAVCVCVSVCVCLSREFDYLNFMFIAYK